MILKNKFCRSVDLATFTPPLSKIPGSAPGLYQGSQRSTSNMSIHGGFPPNILD